VFKAGAQYVLFDLLNGIKAADVYAKDR